MPDTATLARRDGVELIRTGRWDISTGKWTATRDDLAAAVAAMSCPAIQKPIVKIGHTDTRFTPGDGEPAIGWYENLRTTDGGHTLVADQVAPSWLTDVQAAAWPNRSVEGSYRYRCGLGHTHPFVLTAVALLGVTPPGVSTLTSLNSLNDVRSLYGLAASREPGQDELRIAASMLQAAADEDQAPAHTGAMVALIPTAEHAARLAVEGGEPADELHVTLAYLGEAVEFTPKAQASVIDAVRRAVTDSPTLDAEAFAVSVFNPPGMDTSDGRDRDTCIVLGVGGDDLDYVHALAASAARHAALQYGVELPAQHRPWVPHMTLTYTDQLDQVTALTDRCGPVVFDRVRVAFGGQHTDIPLTAVDDAGLFDVPGPMLPVAAAGDGKLRDYWLRGEGAAKIRWGTGGDFTRCVRHLRKHVADPEGLCAEYHHEATGMWPGDRRNVHASQEDTPMPNPDPSLTERIHQAWNAAGPSEQQWIVEAAPDEVIVMDNTDRSLARVPVEVDGDDIRFGEPQRVRPAYVPETEPVAATRMVFASVEESRPDVAAHGTHNQKTHGGGKGSGSKPSSDPSGGRGTVPDDALPVGTRVRNRSRPGWRGVVKNGPTGKPYRAAHGTTDVYVQWADGDGKPTVAGWFPRRGMEPENRRVKASTDPTAPETEPVGDPATGDDPTPGGEPTPELPAAEPEPAPHTDPKEDPVSDLSEVRSRLGLADDAKPDAILAAVEALKAKADSAPNPETVAAARDEMKNEITRLSEELAQIRASAAADTKKTLFDGAVREGRIKPADREKWEARYDRAPDVTTEILASLARNTEVPVAASGYTGQAEAPTDDLAAFEAEMARLDGVPVGGN